MLLCAAALGTLVLLIAARILGGNRDEKRRINRGKLLSAMLKGDNAALIALQVPSNVAADLTIELAELVRGSDRDAFLRSAEALNVPRALQARLRSRSAQDRLTAAEALAMFPGNARLAAQRALEDPNPHVRLGAALALASVQAAPPASDLIRDLGLGTTERSMLVTSLMRDLVEADPTSVERLLYNPALPDAAKLAATDALAASGLAEHAPLVAWMADAAEHDLELQPRIMRALGRIGHPSAEPAILRALDSASWEVRTAAAEAAGRVGITAAVDRLGELLGDEQWWVRFRAGEALARLGNAGRVTLLKVRQAGSPVARVAARETLAERGLD